MRMIMRAEPGCSSPAEMYMRDKDGGSATSISSVFIFLEGGPLDPPTTSLTVTARSPGDPGSRPGQFPDSGLPAAPLSSNSA